jgi:hypothetical protein
LAENVTYKVDKDADFIKIDANGKMTVTPKKTHLGGEYNVAIIRQDGKPNRDAEKITVKVVVPIPASCSLVKLQDITIMGGATATKNAILSTKKTVVTDMTAECLAENVSFVFNKKQDFIKIDKNGKMTVAPSAQHQGGEVEVTIIRNDKKRAGEKDTVKVTVLPNCKAQKFTQLKAFPEAIATHQTIVYDIPTEIPNGWSKTTVCGKTTVSVQNFRLNGQEVNQPEGITVKDGKLTFNAKHHTIMPGTYKFTIVQKNAKGTEQKTDVSITVNCQLVSFDKSQASSQIKDFVYDNVKTTKQIPFAFIAVPERCGQGKGYVATVNGKKAPWIVVNPKSAATGKPELLIKQDKQTFIGSYPVKVTGTIGKIKAASSIDFRVNFFLDKCITGKVEALNQITTGEYNVLEKQSSYKEKILGKQDFSVNLLKNGEPCAASVKYTPQFKQPNTHKWIEFNSANAPKIAKYLRFDEDSQTFTARVAAGVAPSSKDDFTVDLRVGVKVTHTATKKVIGETLSN